MAFFSDPTTPTRSKRCAEVSRQPRMVDISTPLDLAAASPRAARPVAGIRRPRHKLGFHV